MGHPDHTWSADCGVCRLSVRSDTPTDAKPTTPLTMEQAAKDRLLVSREKGSSGFPVDAWIFGIPRRMWAPPFSKKAATRPLVPDAYKKKTKKQWKEYWHEMEKLRVALAEVRRLEDHHAARGIGGRQFGKTAFQAAYIAATNTVDALRSQLSGIGP